MYITNKIDDLPKNHLPSKKELHNVGIYLKNLDKNSFNSDRYDLFMGMVKGRSNNNFDIPLETLMDINNRHNVVIDGHHRTFGQLVTTAYYNSIAGKRYRGSIYRYMIDEIEKDGEWNVKENILLFKEKLSDTNIDALRKCYLHLGNEFNKEMYQEEKNKDTYYSDFDNIDFIKEYYRIDLIDNYLFTFLLG